MTYFNFLCTLLKFYILGARDKRYILVISALFFTSFASANPRIWYVHPDSTLNSIQSALDSCIDNDIVLVSKGIYTENLLWPNVSGIHLISEYGAESTIIDGDSAASVITIDTGIDSTTLIRGFTIQNGGSNPGAGIYCWDGSPTITNNIITENVNDGGGGGILCHNNSAPTISNNIITENIGGLINGNGGGIGCYANAAPNIIDNKISGNRTNRFGGGIGINGCRATVVGNDITNNFTPEIGGGISCIHGMDGIIKDNNISGNTAEIHGGGIHCGWLASPTIIGNRITENIASKGGGIYCREASPFVDSCTISKNQGCGVYCEVWSNLSINFCDIYSNSTYGLRNLDSTITINADYNWWGDASGPGGAGPGIGDEVSAYVDYDPWLRGPVEAQEQQILSYKNQAPNIKILPNPFRSKVNIKLKIVGNWRNKNFSLQVYDITGTLVKNFSFSGDCSLRTTVITWEGKDNYGNKVPPGVYFVRFSTEGFSATEKSLLVN